MDQAESAHQSVFRYQLEPVKTQIWIAISVYVLVAVAKKDSCRGIAPHIPTDFELDTFRENTAGSVA
jgi:hypothetical protein